MSGDEVRATRWGVVAAVIASGVVAAIHVGKVPPALPALRADLDLGLVAGGWVASIFNLVGATLGIAGGMLVDRAGARRALLGGLACLAAGSAGGAAAGDAPALLLARTVAGVGLLAVAVSVPRLVVAVARPRDRGLALGAWSLYMPAGMAAAMAGAPAALGALGWRGVWLLDAALTVALLALVAVATRGVPARPGPRARLGIEALRRPGPWLLAAAFGCYTVQWFAVMTWLPTFLVETGGRGAGTAALAGALVVGANVPGNLAGAWLVHRGVARWKLLAAAFALMAACGAPVFVGGATAELRIAAAVAFSAFGGLLPAAALAAAPAYAPGPEHVATVNGLVVQGSHLGTVLGAPALAALVGALGGWDGGAAVLGAGALAGLAVSAAVRALDRAAEAQ